MALCSCRAHSSVHPHEGGLWHNCIADERPWKAYTASCFKAVHPNKSNIKFAIIWTDTPFLKNMSYVKDFFFVITMCHRCKTYQSRQAASLHCKEICAWSNKEIKFCQLIEAELRFFNLCRNASYSYPYFSRKYSACFMTDASFLYYP